MSAIALFCQDLGAFPATRAKRLHARLRAEGLEGIGAVFALTWPEYTFPQRPIPRENREAFARWRRDSGLELWAWMNATPDQSADGWVLLEQDEQLAPDGWLLDIEGEWVKSAKLGTIAGAATSTGRPVIASLAGASSSHTSYDYRSLDRHGIAIDWQAYFDSNEGPPPADAVRELYRASFVIPGWEYRHRLGSVYGWGRVARVEARQVGVFDSFKRPGENDATFTVAPREWGSTVVDGELRRAGKPVGLLMGRAAYSRIRVTLDTTRTAAARPAGEWEAIAASARVAGARKRPVSVYLAEITSDDVVVAIARGAAQ